MIEYLDVLDRNGNSVGRIKARSRVHWDGDWHRTVHVWIVTSDAQVLIQRRSPEKEIHPDLWDVSCAGHVRSGDSSRMAAVREVQEELGISLSPLELRQIATVRQTYTDGNMHDNEIVDVYVARRDSAIEKLRIQPEEVAEVRMISVSELEQCTHQPNSDFVPHPEEYTRLVNHLRNES